MLIKSIGSEGPTRLFVGGVHGKEYRTTVPILKKFAEIFDKKEELEGKLVIYSFGEESGSYVSTLKAEFYDTDAGKELLSVIDRHSPKIYLELHSYPASNYSGLISPDRPIEKGVPPLVDLGSGVLMHSISPILSKEFDDDDFCILIDVPGGYSPNEKFYEMMGEIAISKNRREAILKLEEMYPEKVDEMRRNYMNFYVTIYRILRPQNDFKT